MNNKTKNLIIIILSFLLLVSLGTTIYLFINKNSSLQEITGTVIVADEDYIIVESEKEDYLIKNIKQKYSLGDEVRITYKEKDIDKKNSPITIENPIEKKLSKKEEETSPTTETKPSSTTTTTKKPNSTTTKAPLSDADTEVLSYVENLKKDFDATSIKDSIKSGFITVVDFIFYDGSIKGHTFKELSDTAKLKVLQMAIYFDKKIETYFPGYKEEISASTNRIYTKVKEEVVESYLNVASKICETNKEACETAKKGFAEIKKTASLTWSLIKDIAGDGVDKLKNWYEIFSGK